MVKSYFVNEQKKIEDREKETKEELEILGAAMRDALASDIPAEEKIALMQFLDGSQERDRGRLKVLASRKKAVSRILKLYETD